MVLPMLATQQLGQGSRLCPHSVLLASMENLCVWWVSGCRSYSIFSCLNSGPSTLPVSRLVAPWGWALRMTGGRSQAAQEAGKSQISLSNRRQKAKSRKLLIQVNSHLKVKPEDFRFRLFKAVDKIQRYNAFFNKSENSTCETSKILKTEIYKYNLRHYISVDSVPLHNVGIFYIFEELFGTLLFTLPFRKAEDKTGKIAVKS
ncbi:PREDICTED: uncharacterized protein LOC108494612 [Lepidothrix coronata]|uniref:Uncharacterized protein LOC108494612 n=1 Tax=Lepidothrix coronata TaxID=321398 RepID=A0A6J0GSB9_9PASS|nr:PREDICTED: uncharacterized protein LOC108494612 [Lepidothrix coronata]